MQETTEILERYVAIPDHLRPVAVLGANDQALNVIEKIMPDIDVSMRGHQITLRGPEGSLDRAAAIMNSLIEIAASGETVTGEAVHRAAELYGDDRRRDQHVSAILSQSVLSARGRTIRPKTIGQKEYVDAIDENTIVFGIGPAGTGKTYLAVAKAVRALLDKQINRIILTRPAVEAGERLGFLPGTLNEK
ncbi:MAG: PhoH family protein, partial [Dermabacter sp.]|nr:PhoH family protein [Dermabacter sp.]